MGLPFLYAKIQVGPYSYLKNFVRGSDPIKFL